MLDAIHEKEQLDIYVGSFSAFESKETGKLRSYCVCTRGVLSLLPRTDLIGFCDVNLPEGQQLLGLFNWERVKAVCGHLLKKTEDILPRYRVEQFPTEEDFQALGPRDA